MCGSPPAPEDSRGRRGSEEPLGVSLHPARGGPCTRQAETEARESLIGHPGRAEGRGKEAE